MNRSNEAALDPFEKAALAFIKERGLLKGGGGVLAALSGGPDSTALLAFLCRLSGPLGLEVTAAHLHHGLRGESADGDADFSRELAARLGASFISERLPRGALEKRGGVQDCARRARYAFLEEARGKAGARWIATGHTADDQAETVILALLRGRGLAGLGGVPPRRGPIVRPILSRKRAEVLEYLERRGLSYRTDPTNFSGKYLRNRVRLELLPLLESHDPAVPGALVRLAFELGEVRERLWEVGRRERTRLFRKEEEGFSMEARALASLHPLVRGELFRLAVADLGGPVNRLLRAHYEVLERLLGKKTGVGGELHLPGGLGVRLAGGRIYFEPRRRQADLLDASYALPLSVPGRVSTPGGAVIEAEAVEIPENPAREGRLTYFLDAEKMPGGINVRNPRPGERIDPLGMQGTKKTSDILADAKIPRDERPLWPVVSGDDGPLWVVGLAGSRSFGLRSRSAKAVRLRAGGAFSKRK